MSSSSHPDKATSAAGSSNVENSVEGETSLRRSARLAAKTAPTNRPTLSFPTRTHQKKQSSSRNNPKAPKRFKVDVKPAATESSDQSISSRRSGRVASRTTTKNPPSKRTASSEEDSEQEESKTTKDDIKRESVLSLTKPKGLASKGKRMGAVLHKSESAVAVSSSDEEEEEASKSSSSKVITTRLRSGKKSVPEEDQAEGAETDNTTRVLRSRVGRLGSKSTAVGLSQSVVTKRAATPVPPVAPKTRKEKERRAVGGTKAIAISPKLKSLPKDTKSSSEITTDGAASQSNNIMSQNNTNRSHSNDPAGLASNIFSALGDLEALGSEDFDVNRLQALLEARGLPSSLFSSLGPRFQQMLGRIGSQGMGGSSQCYNKCNQLLTSLKGSDESAQLASAAELCQMLVMGNEDSLHGFPIKQAVLALTSVISGEGNFELVTQSCRALCYMMESLPRSSAVVTGAIPAFLQKLQSIEYIDIAEQSLVALEMLSRRHAKQILRANGVQAVLSYIDFFSPTAQRNALMITASCCSNLTPEEFEFLQPVLPQLSQRISGDSDKKCVENTCAAFSRIVDCFHNDADRLREIASHGLLQNIQQLLLCSPAVLNSATFIMVIQMLSHICNACPDLAAHLLDNKIIDTLCFLLTGSINVGSKIELSKTARSPQDGYELIRLIVALLPDLPSDGIFEVEDLLRKLSGNGEHAVSWFWKDDSNTWTPYTNTESLTIENAFRTSQEDVLIETPQAQYVIDLMAMHQINEDTGTSREVRRQEMPPTQKRNRPQAVVTASVDSNVALFIQNIFAVLYEVYSTSAGSAIRHKCSEALLKMAYHSSPELLTTVMLKLPISSNIASNLATSDLKSVISAILLANLLMQKLPETFNIHFRREGVVYQMNLCAKGTGTIFKSSTADLLPGVPLNEGAPCLMDASAQGSSGGPLSSPLQHVPTDSSEDSSNTALPRMKLATSRRQVAKRSSTQGPGRRRQPGEDSFDSVPVPSTESVNPTASTATQSSDQTSQGGFGLTPLNRIAMAKMRLAHEGRAMFDRLSSTLSPGSASASSPTPPAPVSSAPCRQQAIEWIKVHAQKFLLDYFPSLNSSQSASLAILYSAIEKLRTEKELSGLKEIKQVILDGNASPFEVIHSNVIGVLLKYLTEPEWLDDYESGIVKRVKRKAKCDSLGTPRRLRLLRFMHVFFDCPSEEEAESNFIDVFDVSNCIDSVPGFQALVAKLSACVNQLEQFPVRVTDLSTQGIGLGSSGSRHPIMRAFAQSQLKCMLSRHPDSPSIRQWRGGMVRVEPLAPIYTIERYLVARGCARTVSVEDNALDTDEVSDEEELDATSMAADAARGNGRHRLELMLNNHALPYNWSLYQCIRHFARIGNGDDAEGDSEFSAGQMALFSGTHTIHYRLVNEEIASQPAASGDTVSTSPLKTDIDKRGANWDNCVTSEVESPLEIGLVTKYPDYVSVRDPSLEVITLLRVLFVLNYHWPEAYQPQSKPLPHLGETDFLNSKLITKMNRQLQDPIMVLTGQTPLWMVQIGTYAPFLFPFESRLQLFYVTAFDRDRAMQRLLDANPELAANRTNQAGSSSGHEQILPRIERRKRTVSRKNLLAQTQTIMEEYAQCRQFLEIQYQDEVGTGLGPTLEFYSLVSKEFQRVDLNLWHMTTDHRSTGPYVYAPCGLYPKPIGRNVTKTRNAEIDGKFCLLGKFMAKALMDFRMTDITFSPVFYKWLLGQEAQLGVADLAHIDPEIAKHVEKLYRIARRKKWLEANEDAVDPKRFDSDSELLYDGTTVDELCLVFTLPGYEDVELCKGGRDKMVTLDNLDTFVNLVTHFYLHEGVSRQMEAFREAFHGIVSMKHLRIFRADELDGVFCGHGEHSEEGWGVKTLMDTCHPDHGFTADSQAVKWLYTIMSQYNSVERRDFVQFVTGSPKLPVGGFKALNPPFTIVRKTVADDQNSDQFLPSVMTCVNYLKLPDYSSMEIMKKRLETACKEGQHSFHLS